MQGDGLIDIISVESWMKDIIFGHGVSPTSNYSDAYYSLSWYSMADMVRQTQFLDILCFVLYRLVSVMYQWRGDFQIPIFIQ